ncbi:MAG TPA: STM3941 family protein [Pyrinomonadaceae bacterium]|nr:STM3941 family protein [Pyrinomonadaceae bacterium]
MNDERLVFEASRLKTLVLLLGCVVFLWVGIAFAQDGDAWAVLVVGLSGLSLLFLLYMLIPGTVRLTIDSSGIVLKSPFRSINLAWTDVDEFYVGYVETGPSTTKLIAIKYSDSYNKQRTGRRVSAQITGMEGAIPNHFKKSPEELCAILNSYKQKYAPAPVNAE